GQGHGLVHELGLAASPDVLVTATLSKSLGAQGGAVLGPPVVRSHLVNTARTFIFDTGLAPAAAGAAAAAARLVIEEPGLAEAVRRNARLIADRCGILQAAGAVQSIPMAGPAEAVEAALELRRRGILVGCFRPPSVPDGISRLRLTARADLTRDALLEAIDTVAAVAGHHGAAAVAGARA
ncbi:MAG TPA: aminotransferase class I/II-fold pyridoxal phosphate-dependent enzyme, partial [Intrasporangium sp.]|uniref:aminotransferase class I/II-fold pyridoxal phosphate-dependent enzyme n=1 Tax=Intrasporangium sp. TaxID=1925024 RepID=UPI002D770639